MKTLREIFHLLQEAFMTTALAEMGVGPAEPYGIGRSRAWEFVKQTFLASVYTEVGEDLPYRPVRGSVGKAIEGLFKPDDCQFGDNESCRVEA